jgi:hypothetical protein
MTNVKVRAYLAPSVVLLAFDWTGGRDRKDLLLAMDWEKCANYPYGKGKLRNSWLIC